MKKKILLIGFQEYSSTMYPHLRCFIDEIKSKCELTYFHCRERGYFFENLKNAPCPRGYISFFASAIFALLDTYKLYLNSGRSYDFIIAIDYFIYTIATNIFKENNIILWSHDLIASDHIFNSNSVFRFIYRRFTQSVLKFKRIIIQSKERAKLLLDHIDTDVENIDIFYMPVFLTDLPLQPVELSSMTRPRLMQCGGIGAHRLSNHLLNHYQKNSEFYRLYFHGRIFKEIKEQLNNANAQPWISEGMIPSEDLHRIVERCDIGFVGYEAKDANFYCIAMASGQMTEFLRLAKPLIIMGRTNLGNFVEEQGIGISIQEVGELNRAIEVIRNNYTNYSEKSRSCFDKFFKSSLYVDNLLEWL